MAVYINDTVNKDTDCETPIPKVCGRQKVHMPTASCDTIHFTGVDDAEINQGQDFDPTEGVHAYDGNGEEIPFTVEPSEVDECQVGEIELEYTATGVGKKLLPKLCGSPNLKLPYCGVERKRLKRNLVIKGIAPPSIRGIERVCLDRETLFNPMDGVSAVDGNGNTLEISHSGTYDGVASGEIASFESIGGKSRSLKVELEPIQDLHGYDKPWSGGAGKNKFPISDWFTAFSTAVNNLLVGDTSIFLPAGTYTLSFDYYTEGITSNVSFWRIYSEQVTYCDATKQIGYGGMGLSLPTSWTNKVVTFTTTQDGWFGIDNGQLRGGVHYRNIQLESGSTATAWAPYENIAPIGGRTEVDTHRTGVNLFDKSKATLGKYINSTPQEITNPAKAHSDYIKIKPNTSYYMSGFANSGYFAVLAFDENDNPITWYSGASKNAPFVATTPSNARFAILNFNIEQIDTLMFCESSEAVAYEPYTADTYHTELEGHYTVVGSDNEPYQLKAVDGIDGDRLRESIVGGTVNWNQLYGGPIPNSRTMQGITFAPQSDGTIIVNGENDGSGDTYYPITENISLVGHVLLLTGCPTGGSVQTYSTYLDNHLESADIGNGNVFKQAIDGRRLFIRIKKRTPALTNAVWKPQLYDLTAMLGTIIADYIYSLETATAGAGVAWLKQHFPKMFGQYNAYDAGSIRSVEGVSGHKVVGFNQWDEEWEVGSIDNATGQPVSASNVIRSKNYIPIVGGQSYFCKCGSTWAQMFAYDAEYNLLGLWGTDGENPKTVPKDARYVKFRTSVSYGTTYNHDICINLSSNRNGEYEPYRGITYPLDSSLTLRGIPKLNNGQLYYDGDVYKSDGSVTRKYGVVDLGTLNWNYDSVRRSMVISAPLTLAKSGSSGTPYNMVCSKYVTDSSEHVESRVTDKTISLSAARYIRVYDTAYTDAATFKTAMSGVMLVYELAIPTTETAEPFEEIQKVINGGTLQYITDSIVPVGHETEYLSRVIYGGTLDIVTGELVVDRAMVDLGTLTWVYKSSGTVVAPYFYASARTLGIKRRGTFQTTVHNIICSKYATVKRDGTVFVDGTICADGDVNAVTEVQIKDFAYGTDATAFKASLNGVQLVYELATPLAYQLTPQEVKLLLGNNNVWSDGEVTVAYPTNIPDGAYNYPFDGVYEITYHAEDKCGNETTEVRQVIVSKSNSVCGARVCCATVAC